jgi:plasmid stabilization system protein ParE
MRLIVRPAAEDDIARAFERYEERRLGLRFLDELNATFSRIRALPRQFPLLQRNLRRALLRRFPYAVYFLPRNGAELVIIAVLHQRRKPATWRRRRREEQGLG